MMNRFSASNRIIILSLAETTYGAPWFSSFSFFYDYFNTFGLVRSCYELDN